MSMNGLEYTAADNGKITNQGQQILTVTTNEGRQGKTCCQVGDVTRPLMSVSQVADAGNIIMLDSHGGWVHSLIDDSWTRVRRFKNVYELDWWLTSEEANGKLSGNSSPTDAIAHTMLETFKDVLKKSGFTRPGM